MPELEAAAGSAAPPRGRTSAEPPRGPMPSKPALAPPCARPVRLSGWGGGPAVEASLWRPRDLGELAERLRLLAARGASDGMIPRGMGRSYGDAAQLAGGLVLQTGALRSFELDRERGILTAEAGVTAAELLRELVPRGFVLPVLPGTQHVSIGGMIASDVHGKNHGEAGSIGAHVLALGLLRADGELVELAPDGDREQAAGFAATLGGMGLTGVVAWARIALRRVAGPLMTVDTDRAHDLDSVLALLREPGGSHRVAWLDLLAAPGRVRGVVTRAEFAGEAENAAARARPDVQPLATVPRWWPGGLPRLGVRAFNELRFRSTPARERGRLEPLGAHMFPLDRLAAWPRLYGPAGFVQYQLAVPFGAERVLEQVLLALRAHSVPCFLAVLKDFGEGSGAPLSFPIRGWTLALDLPRAAAGLEQALVRCDELVAAAGGRVYLSKDSRLRPDALAAMYPRLDEWRELRARLDPLERWRSDLGLRLGLVEGAGRACACAFACARAFPRAARAGLCATAAGTAAWRQL
jgi:decaprenylphospho-beta-D-ribofuranose 2-oxidase